MAARKTLRAVHVCGRTVMPVASGQSGMMRALRLTRVEPTLPLSLIAANWPLLLGMGVLMLGAGLQGTLLSLRGSIEGFSAPVVGMVMSCYYLGYLLGTNLAPRLLLRVGHIRVFAALTTVASAAILAQGMFVYPWPWALFRLVSGVCFAGIYVVAESWLNDRATSENRGRLLAIYMVVLYLGLGCAQFLLLAWDVRTASPFMLVAMLISLALVPIVVSANQLPQRAAPLGVRLRDLYRNSPLGVVAVSVSGLISSTIYSIGPVYAKARGLSTAGIAIFMALSILAGVLTQDPVGRLSDRMDRRSVIAGICAVTTLAAAALASVRDMPPLVFYGLTATFSGLVLTLYSLAVSHVNDKIEPAQMVAASSAMLLLNGAAAAIGPTLSGSLMAAFGPRAYFVTLGSLTGALTLYDLWRKTRRKPVAAAQKGPFINVRPRA